jgi:hypothetical protein
MDSFHVCNTLGPDAIDDDPVSGQPATRLPGSPDTCIIVRSVGT